MSVWVSSTGQVDLGTSGDYGNNVLFGRYASKRALDDSVYAVYNANPDSTAYAVGNYWEGEDTTYGLVDMSNPLYLNPFTSGAAKLAADIIKPAATDGGDLDHLQAYPNPFNASATIRYNLATPQRVDVMIYNILGQRVRTLWSGMKEAGEHFLEWDGRDGSGRAVASGVYFYRVSSETRQITKSIALVK